MPLPDASTSALWIFAYDQLAAREADKVWLWNSPWCIIDITTVDTTHVIPSHLFTPYAGTSRHDSILNRTDMLPIFFKRLDGGIGVRIAGDADYNTLPDIPTRISRSSLKVFLHVSACNPYDDLYMSDLST